MNAEYLEMNETENLNFELNQRYLGFPEDLSYGEFRCLTPETRKQVILRNPILHTDSYNRTMEYLGSEDAKTEATYALQFRKSPHGYLILAGINELVEKISSITITQDQLDFAKDYFASTSGIKYFNPKVWQEIIDDHKGKIPIEIYAPPEGTAVLPGDPVLRVKGPNEVVAHFEPYFHHLFYPSLVATNAHEITRIVGPGRFIEVGLRGAETEEKHMIAVRAMYIGGGIKSTSSDMANAYYPQFNLVGTMGHRFVQAFETEEEAFRTAIERTDSISLLIDLNNSIDGIDLALKLKQEYRQTGKKIWIRLDSGNILEQTLYVLGKQKKLGMQDPTLDKVVVEGIEHLSEIDEIENAVTNKGIKPKDFVTYGAGYLLITDNTTRNDASTGFKITKLGDRPTAKFSDTPGKRSIPGEPTIIFKHGRRVISQVGEKGWDLFRPVYKNGLNLVSDNIEIARANAIRSFDEISDEVAGQQRSQISPRTENLIFLLKQKVMRGGEL
jgi:nicotinate phosphoribosyltransferase